METKAAGISFCSGDSLMERFLFCIVADRNMKAVVEELIPRVRNMDGLSFAFRFSDVIVHPRHDPGCYWEGPELIADRVQADSRLYGMLLLDFAWEGHSHRCPEEMQQHLQQRMERAGQRALAVVLDPELEEWVFVRSPRAIEAMGWTDWNEAKRVLQEAGLWKKECTKPEDPKKAMEVLLRSKGIPRSSSVYREIARFAGLKHCRSRSFTRIRMALQRWFSIQGELHGRPE